jgi:hypothetical protein
VPPCGHCLQQPKGSSTSKGTRVWVAPRPIQQQASWAKHLDSAWANTNSYAKLPILTHSMPHSCMGLVVSKGARQPTCCHKCSHVMAVTTILQLVVEPIVTAKAMAALYVTIFSKEVSDWVFLTLYWMGMFYTPWRKSIILHHALIVLTLMWKISN